MEEYIAYQRLVNEAESVWHKAKNENDYAAFAPYIDGIHVCNATNKLQICVCSFGDRMSISVTSCFTDTAVQRRLFRHLRTLDPDLIIETNLLDDDA